MNSAGDVWVSGNYMTTLFTTQGVGPFGSTYNKFGWGGTNAWNYPDIPPEPPTSNGESATTIYVSALTAAADDGVPRAAVENTRPAPAWNVPQTTPPATTGGSVQEGAPAINAVNTFAGVLPANSVQVFRWQ